MKGIIQRLAVGFTGIAIVAVLVIVGALFFEGLSSSNTVSQWTLAVAGWTIVPVMVLAAIAGVIAYPR